MTNTTGDKDKVLDFFAKIQDGLNSIIYYHEILGHEIFELSLFDLVYYQSYRKQISTYATNVKLYEKIDPSNHDDFFYIKTFRNDVVKNAESHSYIGKLKLETDEAEYTLEHNRNKDDQYLFNFEKSDFHPRLFAYESKDMQKNPPDYKESDVQTFFKSEAHTKTVKVTKGYYYRSKEDYIVFVLAIGFGFINDALNARVNEFFDSPEYINMAHEFFIDLFIADLITHKIFLTKKATLAEVCARTTSHNTGSHILARRLGPYLQSPKEVLQFQSYLRQRMLYNVDMVSASPSFEKTEKLNDLLKDFKSLDFVTECISGVNGMKFGDFILSKSRNRADKGKIKRLNISLSNGILGKHALFILFENLIRNYFKHNSGRGRLFDKENNTINIEITLDERFSTNKYHCLNITDGSSLKGRVINDRIIKFLFDPILNKDNKLRSEGLGFLEIRAALCYLNNIPLKEIDSFQLDREEEFPKVIELVLDDHINKNTYGSIPQVKDEFLDTDVPLIYRIYLKKPKEILIIADNFHELSGQLKEVHGITVIKMVEKKSTYPHRFVIVTGQEHLTMVEENRVGFQHRIFCTSNVKQDQYPVLKPDIWDFMCSHTTEQCIEYLYQEWINHKISTNELFSLPVFMEVNGLNKQPAEIEMQYKSKLPSDKTYKKILFDSHGNNYHIAGKFDNYEPVSSHAKKFRSLIEFTLDQPPLFWFELIEAFNISICIIDERIQAYSNECSKYVKNTYNNDSVTERDVMKRIDIFTPNQEEVNLHSKNFIEDKLECEIHSYITKLPKIHYFLIHLGIIEKFLVNKDRSNIQDWVKKNFTDKLKYQTEIILISERGAPRTIPEDFRFIDFSNVFNAVIEERAKYFVSKLIFSARKTCQDYE